jgi:hypothetical protein
VRPFALHKENLGRRLGATAPSRLSVFIQCSLTWGSRAVLRICGQKKKGPGLYLKKRALQKKERKGKNRSYCYLPKETLNFTYWNLIALAPWGGFMCNQVSSLLAHKLKIFLSLYRSASKLE